MIELIRLARPIVVARSGIIMLTMVDMIMVGHFDPTELAYQAIGLSLFMPMVVIGMGLLTGTLVLCANCYGAGNLAGCGEAWRRSLPYAFGLGTIGLAVTLPGEWLLTAAGQSPDLAAYGGEVMWINGLSLPAFLVFMTTAFFLEGIKRPRPWMVTITLANVLNLVLNWILIYGNFGAPEMGAAGAAWATTAARWFVVVALVAYVWRMRDGADFAVRRSPDLRLHTWRAQRQIGYAASVSVGVESCAFATLSLFAGWLGALPLAAFSVCFNLITMVFMISLGIGAATAVTVGVAYGGRQVRRIGRAGWNGVAANSVAMIVIGALFVVTPGLIARIFTNDAALISIAGPMIAFLAFVLIVDGGQAVLANALRGRRDVWVPCGLQILAYVAIMVPAAYFFTFTLNNGAVGLLEGVLLASTVSILLQGWRFEWLARRDRSEPIAAQQI